MLMPLSAMPSAEQIAANEAHIKYTQRVYEIKNRFYNLRMRKQNKDIQKVAEGMWYLDEEEYDKLWNNIHKCWWWQ